MISIHLHFIIGIYHIYDLICSIWSSKAGMLTADMWRQWMANPSLCWGVGPVAVVATAFIITALPLEWLIRQPFMQKYLITYGVDSKKNDGIGRPAAIRRTQEKVPLTEQVKGTALTLAGPAAIVGGVISALAIPFVITYVADQPILPSLGSFLFSTVAMKLIDDFGLYLGHRVQHEVPFLWKHFHSHHHKLTTPTPVSTLYIDATDAMLQGSLPIIAALFFMQPHPFTAYFHIATRIGENAVNHSGLECWWIDVLTLKVLPFRASAGHHDSHHRFSNYSGNAKNFGEMFVIWDWIFGSLRSKTVGNSNHSEAKKVK